MKQNKEMDMTSADRAYDNNNNFQCYHLRELNCNKGKKDSGCRRPIITLEN